MLFKCKDSNNIDKRILFSDLLAFFNQVKRFPLRICSNVCRTFLESLKKPEQKNPGIQTHNGLKYDDFNQIWYEVATDVIFAKIQEKKKIA